jgi:hypothetical protein
MKHRVTILSTVPVRTTVTVIEQPNTAEAEYEALRLVTQEGIKQRKARAAGEPLLADAYEWETDEIAVWTGDLDPDTFEVDGVEEIEE